MASDKKQVETVHVMIDDFLKNVMESDIKIDPIILISVMFKTAGITLAENCESHNFEKALNIHFSKLIQLNSEGKL